jgi:hypothetical protein
MEFKEAKIEFGSLHFEVYYNMNASSLCYLVKEFIRTEYEFEVRMFCRWCAGQVRKHKDLYPYEEDPGSWIVIPKRELDSIIISYGYESN